MKLYLEPIQVRLATDQRPARLVWRRRLYRVRGVEECWRYNGQWWTTPQLRGRFRCYYRLVVTTIGGTVLQVEIYREAGRWMLSRLGD